MNASAVTSADRQGLLPLAKESRAVEARWTLYASTGLDLRRTDLPQDFPSDVHVDGVCFRLVGPTYYAWLHRRMESAKRRHDKGALSREAWDSLRDRFNRMQAWAIDRYGKDTLAQAMRTFRPDRYQPPVKQPSNPRPATTPPAQAAPRFRFPTTGDFRFEHPVPPEAVATVDAIRDRAESLGWAEARLYQNRGRFAFPCGQDWGLVCFVGPEDALGAITETHIEIIHDRHGRKNTLRFANADTWPPRIQPQEESIS
jgi:hypothetical protein